jgi:uncharacterized protein YggU (UPF0235/DUF167 family)
MSKQKLLSKIVLKFHVGIKCSKTQIKKYEDKLLDIQLKAVPEKGETNSELISFISNWPSIPKNQIVLSIGLNSRNKVLELYLTDEEKERLMALLRSLS